VANLIIAGGGGGEEDGSVYCLETQLLKRKTKQEKETPNEAGMILVRKPFYR
jgi:hypothetical protein